MMMARARCLELGDMSSAAPRRCCGTSSTGRAHTKEGHQRAPLNREAGEGGDALYRWKSSMTDGRVDNRHRGVLIADRVWARWEEGGGSVLACTWRSRAGCAHAASQSGAARGGVGWTRRCAYCLDVGVRAELDGVPWPRQPRDSSSAQQGHPPSREAHAARRRLHMASGAAADDASARAHMAGHATRSCLDRACRYAAQPGHRGTVAAVACAHRLTCGSGMPAAQQAPTGASGSATRKGGWKRVVGGLRRGVWPESMPAGRQARAEEVHGERFGKSREGLTTGPHAEVIQREKNGRLTHGTVKAPGSTWQWHTQRERAGGAGS
jgi:hypothetical protein